MWYTLACIVSYRLVLGDYIDRDSPFVKNYAALLRNEAARVPDDDIGQMIGYLEGSFHIYPNASVADLISSSYMSFNMPNEAFEWLKISSIADPSNTTTMQRIGLAYHYNGHFSEAIGHYKRAIQIVEMTHQLALRKTGMVKEGSIGVIHEVGIIEYLEELSELWFNIGVSEQYAGNVESSADAYFQAITVTSTANLSFPQTKYILVPHIRAQLNFAALHHGYGVPKDGIIYYRNAVSSIKFYNAQLAHQKESGVHNVRKQEEVSWLLLTMTQTNLGAALIQSDQIKEVSCLYGCCRVMIYKC